MATKGIIFIDTMGKKGVTADITIMDIITDQDIIINHIHIAITIDIAGGDSYQFFT